MKRLSPLLQRLFPLLERLCSRRRPSPRHRQPAADLVEYGLIAACIAFVGVVGLNALSAAERSYFTGLPVASPPSGSAGEPMHTTTFSQQPVCSPVNQVPLGQQITCTGPNGGPIVVQDTNPSGDVQAPLGTVTLQLDSGGSGALSGPPCQLAPRPPNPNGATDSSSCPSVTLTTPVNDLALTSGTCPPACHTLTIYYTTTSNHVSGPSGSIPVTFSPAYSVPAAPQCTVGTVATTSVDIGRPITCTITIYNLSNQGQLADNVDVAWTAPIGTGPTSATGTPFLTCATLDKATNTDPGAAQILQATLYGIGNNCSPQQAVHCTTGPSATPPNPSGQCSVVYRLEPTSAGTLGPGSQNLTVSLNNGTPLTFPSWSLTVTQGPSTPVNPAAMWLSCTRTGATGVTDIDQGTVTLSGHGDQQLTFPATTEITMQVGSSSVPCQALVLDEQPSTGTYCKAVGPWCGTNPDQQDGFAPTGQVQFLMNSSPIGQPCQLVPTASLPVAPNGTPYGSLCSIALPLASPVPTNGALSATYVGPTHSVDLNLSPSVALVFTP